MKNKKNYTFFIKGAHCHSCEILLEDAFNEISGVNSSKVNYMTGKVSIDYKGNLPLDKIDKTVVENGYELGKPIRNIFSINKNIWKDFCISIVIIIILYIARNSFDISKSLGFDLKNISGFGGMMSVGLIAGLSSCMAVVGGIVLTLSTQRGQNHTSLKAKYLPQFFFNGGRLIGFFALGGLLGVIGSAMQFSGIGYMIIYAVVGVIMILSGIQMTETMPIFNKYTINYPKELHRIVAGIFGGGSERREAFGLGAATFFIPCGFTLAAQAYAASTGSFLGGGVAMLGFAIGTLPGIVGIGLLPNLKGKRSQFLIRFLGLILILFALYNFKLAGEYLQALGINSSSNGEKSQISSTQELHITQDNRGYHPTSLSVKAGTHVKLMIDSQDQYSCSSTFTIPSKGIAMKLNPGENTTEFDIDTKGEIIFGCGMMMYKGKIIAE